MSQEKLLDLMKYAFHKTPTGGDEAFYKLLTFSKAYTNELEGQLTSAIIDSHFNVFYGGENVSMSGIGYVASYPEYRGKSYVSDLMLEILKDNYNQGTVFSYLAPFSYSFYRKFGYEYVFNQKSYDIPFQYFPKGLKGDGKIVRLNFEEALPQMDEIHKLVSEIGSVNRTHDQWSYYFEYKSKPNFAVYYENDLPVGYIIYEFSSNNFVIRELTFLTDEAKDALYFFVSSHASAFESVKYKASEKEIVEWEMSEPSQAKILINPYMMARIVNMEEFMKTSPIINGRVEIIDEQLPENNGIYGEGEGEIRKLSIGKFTQEILRQENVILREYF
ncbi:hypothetical protein BG261_00940 [Floricoccus tropicus]|uniref:N-acetyltransferase domain-containing protein n=1 Tax=Floricoccus tropicus TaxID=1859473 RepID=A0A1E8GR32_9LACT|nr:GNAT family N-acetyltransferase [Floricoccus tropicus]OFI50476.1 hypothetical protein BG261_00940 [Floricoccus tropicus]